jgi:hypothetical protein
VQTGYDGGDAVYRRVVRTETVQRVCDLLRVGVRREAACARVGIAASTLWRWCEHSDQVLAQIKAAEAEAECLARFIHRRHKPQMNLSSPVELGPISARGARLNWADSVHE